MSATGTLPLMSPAVLPLKQIAWIALVGALARVAAFVLIPSPGGLIRLEPSIIAANLNSGRGFVFEQYGTVYRAWKEPLHMVLLAQLTRWAGDGDVPVIVAQGVLGILVAVGVAGIARHVLGDPVRALAAGVIAAVNPLLVYYDTHVIHYLGLVTVLFVAVTGGILLAIDGTRATVLRAVLAGLVMGLAVWVRGTLLAAGAVAWGAAILSGPPGERKRLATRGAIACALAVLVISPWIVRNYLVVGRPVLVTDFPHQVWLGNNPRSNGTFSDSEGRRTFYLAEPAFQARIYGAPELVQHDVFLAEVKRFIAENPGRYAALCVRRLFAFVWFSPNAGVGYPPWQASAGKAAYALLLGAGVVGFVRHWRGSDERGRRRALVLLASISGVAVVHSLTVINMNHRVPLELGLAVFAAANLSSATPPRSLGS